LKQEIAIPQRPNIKYPQQQLPAPKSKKGLSHRAPT
jgi:hypothetical protein